MTAEKIPYLYVTGASYSGSTLLAFLLNSHPAIVSVSEAGGQIQNVETYRCSCGARLLDCPFYLELEGRIRALGSSFDRRNWSTVFKVSDVRVIDIALARPLRSVLLEAVRDLIVPLVPGYIKRIREIERRVEHFAEAALAIRNKTVFADLQKDSIRIKFLSQIPRLDLRVVHLVRDVRGGSSSFMKHQGFDSAKAAKLWRTANMNSERARRFVPSDRWMRLRYEEVSDDPQAAVDRISDFVGVPRADLPGSLVDTEHHIVGNAMRLRAIDSIARDESWKTRLSAQDLETIVKVAGRANRLLGGDWP